MPDRSDSSRHAGHAARRDAAPIPEGTYVEAGVPQATARALFDAARTYHQARPWRVLGVDRPLAIELPEHAPVRAAVLGADGTAVGLALLDADVAGGTGPHQTPAATAAGALTLTFAPRADVPAPLADEASAAGWPLASPQAFPLAVRGGAGGEPLRYADAAEAGLLVLVLRAVAAFCGRHARALRAGEDVASGEAVVSVDGERVVVRLRTLAERPDSGAEPASGRGADETDAGESPDPTDPAAAAGEPGEATDVSSGAGSGYVLELDRLRTMTTTLRGAKAAVQRLRWSFFRAGDARQAQDPVAHERALSRFLEWAIFAAPVPPDGRTLAQRAIDEATDLPPSERARLHTIAQPRYSVYVVEDVELNVGLTVRDTVDDGVFRVRERRATPQLSPGQLLLGPLFPDAAGGFVLGGSCSGYGERDGQELPSLPPGTRNAEFAPALELALHGASTDWIAEIGSLAELRSVYEEFAAALRATHTRLPTIARLQRLVREHESPAEVLRVVEPVEWWSATEPTVFLGLLQRLSRLTPQPPPDAGAAADERAAAQPRARRVPSGRKTRRRR